MALKNFLYCKTRGNNIDEFEFISKHGLGEFISRWMSPGNLNADLELSDWLDNADIGEYCEHRLGLVIRLKDRKEDV